MEQTALFKVRNRIAMRVSIQNLVANAILSVVKLLAGLFAHSTAMLSDAANSLSDVFSMVVLTIGMKMSGKEADTGHPYGHERMECVVAILLSMLVLATGLGIGYSGIQKMILATEQPLEAPGALALAVALFAIAAKEGMYWYTRAAAKKIHSSALMATAWDHRADVLSSIGSFAGILGARLGFPILDPIASVICCLFILKAAYSIFRDATGKMMDKACDAETIARIRALATAQPGVLGVDKLRTRVFGDRFYVDIEILADGNASLTQAHAVAERVHDSIETSLPQVKHCMVHVNPTADFSQPT